MSDVGKVALGGLNLGDGGESFVEGHVIWVVFETQRIQGEDIESVHKCSGCGRDAFEVGDVGHGFSAGEIEVEAEGFC